MLLPEQRFDVERKGQLDGLARGTRGRDDDDASSGAGRDERIVVWREVRVADAAVQRLLGVYCGFSGLIAAFGSGALVAAADPPGADVETPVTPEPPPVRRC